MLWFRAPEKVYIKRGCMPVALQELKDVMGKKRAFIVTDSFLYKNGYTKPITDKLDEMGITYTTFADVEPDPSLISAQKGAEAMRKFEPDCIIALGGGSAMDAGKIMWVLYEHPEVDFQDMAMRFCDIRKRVYTSRRWVRKHTSLLSQHHQVQVLRLLLSQLSQTRIQALSIRLLTISLCLKWQSLMLTT